MRRGHYVRLGFAAAGLLCLAILLLSDNGASRAVRAFSSGPLPGNTGAPGEQTCLSCHSGSGGSPDRTFTIVDVPQTYRPGYTYEIGVRHTSNDPTRKRWGFQLTALTADNKKAGNFQVEEGITQVLDNVGPSGNRQYIEHNLEGTFNGRNSAVWYFYWEAPSTNVGPVTFYAAGNQANGDGENTGDDILTDMAISLPPTNPIDEVTFFVTQHYFDFLDRSPDPSGLAFWSSLITNCNSDAQCIQEKRAQVSSSFFYSIEFQQTAFFDNRIYQVAYGRGVTYPEFVFDMSVLGVGLDGDLTGHRTFFLESLTHSANFLSLYAVLQNPAYVDALLKSSGITITAAERNALIAGLNTGSESRGSVLAKLADNQAFQQAQFNPGFVLLAYYCYVRRSPDDAEYAFWLDKLNQPSGDAAIIDMIKLFITSAEYRQRFGPVSASQPANIPPLCGEVQARDDRTTLLTIQSSDKIFRNEAQFARASPPQSRSRRCLPIQESIRINPLP